MRLLKFSSLTKEEEQMVANPNITDKKDKYIVIHYHDKWAVFDELREKVLAVLDSSEMANETALMFARVEHRRAVLFQDAA
ncbi:MAG: hypothetical protein KDC73_12765 [Ignavibacteriae bacterium]|nr:hypothetical protein [Ignavibacteriota bacterium]MCB9242865.1 hypothetical protein [Ignavibacteriales bacterium]